MRKSFTKEQKKAIVAEAESSGNTIAAVTKKHGIGESTFYNWKKDFTGGGRRKKKARATAGSSDASSKLLKSIRGKSLKDLASTLAPAIAELKGVQNRLNRELQQVTSAIRALEGR